MRGLAVARLRHQPAQAVLVAVLAGTVALAAVLGVAYARAVEESVQRQVLAGAAASARGVSVTASGEQPPAPDALRAAVAPALRDPAFGTPVGGASADGLLTAGGRRVLAPVVARDGVCAHLAVVAGRCSTGPGDVLVSRRTATLLGADVGTRLKVADAGGSGAAEVPGLPVLRVFLFNDTQTTERVSTGITSMTGLSRTLLPGGTRETAGRT